ncbi:MAG: DNA repair protein RecN [Bacteroidetes bacterium]|nr:DNA repair protein RecN [Bacteroidota bacterium]
MLLNLSIRNFILIQNLDLGFHSGFTCITGETGAGKSILVGALGLILGQRADSQVLMDKSKKCIVEGSFQLEGYGLEAFFTQNDLDFEKISTFRREINPQGKSRAFINDTPVNLNVLKEVGDRLVDIHSQNQTLELNDAGFQLAMIDSYAGNARELIEYAGFFNEYKSVKAELAIAIEKEKKANADKEYYEFQLNELLSANLVENELEEFESELELLTHAEEIKSKLFVALQLLADSDQNILSGLTETRQAIIQASRYSSQLESVSSRIEGTYIELKEISAEFRQLIDHVHHDPERVQFLTQRLDLIYHLQQKHKLGTVLELIQLREELAGKIYDINSLTDKIEHLNQQLELLDNKLLSSSSVLSKKRKQVSPGIEKEMEALLADLGMPSAKFIIKTDSTITFSVSGTDKVSFLFSANKGGELREIQKVASGGELSRLMLGIKSLVVSRSLLPTILFDEIDSGVSGEIAGKIGNIMRKMSATMQVIAITHLPQIAGKSHEHVLAFKEDGEINTTSTLRVLNEDERINEIARMLSDETITDSARAAAKELMVS